MYRHHTFEERLHVVSRIQLGEPLESLCRKERLDKKKVRQWYLRYQKYGEEGLRGTRSYHYSKKEKIKIVEECMVKGLPLQEICLRYDLNRSTIQTWMRKIRQGISLENKRRGHPLKAPCQDLRRKNLRQNLKNFRRKISVCGLRMRC